MKWTRNATYPNLNICYSLMSFLLTQKQYAQNSLCMSRRLHFLLRNPVGAMQCSMCVRSPPCTCILSHFTICQYQTKAQRKRRAEAPSLFPFCLFIWLQAYLKRKVPEMPRPWNLIDLTEAEIGLTVNDIWQTTKCAILQRQTTHWQMRFFFFFHITFRWADILHFYSSILILGDI